MRTDIEENYNKIYKYCFFHVHDRILAEDLTQETFLRALPRGMEGELPYLYTVAGNLCTDYYRKREREVPCPKETEWEEQGIPGERENIPEKLLIREAVLSMPREAREFVYLRFVLEESVSVVAEILGISRFAVYRREKMILKELREKLKEGG